MNWQWRLCLQLVQIFLWVPFKHLDEFFNGDFLTGLIGFQGLFSFSRLFVTGKRRRHSCSKFPPGESAVVKE
jgi:hypothetical protein